VPFDVQYWYLAVYSISLTCCILICMPSLQMCHLLYLALYLFRFFFCCIKLWTASRKIVFCCIIMCMASLQICLCLYLPVFDISETCLPEDVLYLCRFVSCCIELCTRHLADLSGLYLLKSIILKCGPLFLTYHVCVTNLDIWNKFCRHLNLEMGLWNKICLSELCR
jgi:hypothetical protein